MAGLCEGLRPWCDALSEIVKLFMFKFSYIAGSEGRCMGEWLRSNGSNVSWLTRLGDGAADDLSEYSEGVLRWPWNCGWPQGPDGGPREAFR